ncbi:MAG: hypothetical protein EZS28_023277 [Streblomastix strix]|uniref:Uncharacterized protein n=1 Tax=Streblomastix strix TaxID=222440 RepID=A0A5J4VFD3_9EUKA|nr:MAG: hypothetical protein EZS28_023277 [Streblomastix strix]
MKKARSLLFLSGVDQITAPLAVQGKVVQLAKADGTPMQYLFNSCFKIEEEAQQLQIETEYANFIQNQFISGWSPTALICGSLETLNWFFNFPRHPQPISYTAEAANPPNISSLYQFIVSLINKEYPLHHLDELHELSLSFFSVVGDKTIDLITNQPIIVERVTQQKPIISSKKKDQRHMPSLAPMRGLSANPIISSADVCNLIQIAGANFIKQDSNYFPFPFVRIMLRRYQAPPPPPLTAQELRERFLRAEKKQKQSEFTLLEDQDKRKKNKNKNKNNNEQEDGYDDDNEDDEKPIVEEHWDEEIYQMDIVGTITDNAQLVGISWQSSKLTEILRFYLFSFSPLSFIINLPNIWNESGREEDVMLLLKWSSQIIQTTSYELPSSQTKKKMSLLRIPDKREKKKKKDEKEKDKDKQESKGGEDEEEEDEQDDSEDQDEEDEQMKGDTKYEEENRALRDALIQAMEESKRLGRDHEQTQAHLKRLLFEREQNAEKEIEGIK